MEEKKVEVSKEEVKEVKKPESRYELAEIVTQTGIAVKDNNTEKVFAQEELLVEVLNKLDNVERAIFQK